MSATSAGVRREQRRCTPEAGSSERRLKKSDAETTPGGSVCRAGARLGSWDPEHEGRECQQGEERREGLEWEQGEEREGGGLRGSDVGGALRRDSEELGAVAGARQGTSPPSRGHMWVRGFFFPSQSRCCVQAGLRGRFHAGLLHGFVAAIGWFEIG